MASTWGLSWLSSWGNSWGPIDAESQVKGSKAKKRLKRVFKEKGYFLEDEKYESDAALPYEIVAEIEYETVTEEIQGIEVTHEKPVQPTLEAVQVQVLGEPLTDLIQELEVQVQKKRDQVFRILLNKYQRELEMIEEELMFMLIALSED